VVGAVVGPSCLVGDVAVKRDAGGASGIVAIGRKELLWGADPLLLEPRELVGELELLPIHTSAEDLRTEGLGRDTRFLHGRKLSVVGAVVGPSCLVGDVAVKRDAGGASGIVAIGRKELLWGADPLLLEAPGCSAHVQARRLALDGSRLLEGPGLESIRK